MAFKDLKLSIPTVYISLVLLSIDGLHLLQRRFQGKVTIALGHLLSESFNKLLIFLEDKKIHVIYFKGKYLLVFSSAFQHAV